MVKSSTFLAVIAQLCTASVSFGAVINRGTECDPSKLNTTTGTYVAGENTTIWDIARATKRGACDIARGNQMADPNLVSPGATYDIPAQVCNPDSTSCFVPEVDAHSTRDCIAGGTHTYTIQLHDTTNYVARKLNISAQAINSTAGFMLGAGGFDFDAELPVDTDIKLPQCQDTTCSITPYQLSGPVVFYDLAKKYGSTLGQIQALNPQYNHSEGASVDGPVITLVANCTSCPNGNCTAIS